MGYAAYTLPDGREAGYGIEATCDEPGCDARIDRGLAYLCGHEPADGLGCGDYFCADHLYLGAPWPGGQWCRTCLDTERCVACGSTDITGHGESLLHDLRYAVCPNHFAEGYEHAMAEHQPCDCTTESPGMDTERLEAIRVWWETDHNNLDVMDLLDEVYRLRGAIEAHRDVVNAGRSNGHIAEADQMLYAALTDRT